MAMINSSFCLLPEAQDRFKKALRDGEINPETLAAMSSAERHTLFAGLVGKENATGVNSLFESKLLLKNQQTGMINWAKKVAGMKPEIKRDLISRIERLDHVLNPVELDQFLQDLATTRLGFGVTQEEAKTISDLSNKSLDLRTKANEKGIFPTENDRLAYGMSRVNLEEYVNNLKLQAGKVSFAQPIQKVKSLAIEVPGAMKSIVASFDNSLWGRQGIKTLLDVRTANIWAKNFAKSWNDIGREIRAKDAMSMVKADIYSRPNALNGKYKAGRYGLDTLSEEAYPSSWPEKIPAFGRLFKASEAAYNGGALRLRADLADRLIAKAEKQGINTLNKEQAQGMGQLISSMTGRGSLGKLEPVSKEINVLFFSIKFLKSNLDTLTAHQFDPKATQFTKSEARKNLISIVATLAFVLTMAKLLDPKSVDQDPRSTNFGKIKILGHWVDITGGMGSLVTLLSRITPTWHAGKLSFWTKSKNGIYTDLLGGQYGQQTALDVMENFLEGKLSPFAGIVRDIWQGKDYSGQKVTPLGEAQNVGLPLVIQNVQSFKDSSKESMLSALFLDGLGLSVSPNTQSTKDWSQSTSKELQAFKDQVGEDKFKQANQDYNKQLDNWNRSHEQYLKDLPEEDKQPVLTKVKQTIQSKVLKSYGFKFQPTKPKKLPALPGL